MSTTFPDLVGQLEGVVKQAAKAKKVLDEKIPTAAEYADYFKGYEGRAARMAEIIGEMKGVLEEGDKEDAKKKELLQEERAKNDAQKQEQLRQKLQTNEAHKRQRGGYGQFSR